MLDNLTCANTYWIDAVVALTVNLAVNGFATYTLLSGASYSKTLAKVLAVWYTLAGSQCLFAPASAAKAWKMEQGVSPGASFMLQLLGQNCAAFGVFIGALASDVEPMKAFGYGWIPIILGLGYTCILTNSAQDAGADAGKAYPWLIVAAVTIGTLSM